MDCSDYTEILHCTVCLLLHGTLGHFSASGHWQGPHVSSSLGPSPQTHGHTSPGELVTRARAAAQRTAHRAPRARFRRLERTQQPGPGPGWLAGRAARAERYFRQALAGPGTVARTGAGQ